MVPTVVLRHGRMVLCCMWAILLFTASSAEARWLDRARGISAGAHVVHQASVTKSLTQNVAELTDLFGDMLDAVKEGDAAKVEGVWRDIEKVPGDIVREAFPVLGVVDAAASLAEGVKNRLDAAKKHVERFAEEVVGLDPRSALAISEDERHYYVSTTGILGDKPLPSVTFSTAMQASADTQWKEARTYDYQTGSGNNSYEEALNALDRRKAQFEAEHHQEIRRDYASNQEGIPSPESAAVVPEDTIERSVESNSTPVTPTPAAAKGSERAFVWVDLVLDGESKYTRYCGITELRGEDIHAYPLKDHGRHNDMWLWKEAFGKHTEATYLLTGPWPNSRSMVGNPVMQRLAAIVKNHPHYEMRSTKAKFYRGLEVAYETRDGARYWNYQGDIIKITPAQSVADLKNFFCNYMVEKRRGYGMKYSVVDVGEF